MNRPHRQEPLRIATRSSALAMAQARSVAEALPAPTELVGISTRADRSAGPLADIGGKGLFTAELEAALRRRELHLAVHSAKDLPADMPDDLVIAAVPPRQDPRDAIVSPGGRLPADLPAGARVGTSSLRRSCQVRSVRPEAVVVPLRGNVETRLGKLHEGQCDAVVLALAGLNRLGLTDGLGGSLRPLDAETFVPAAGQGALAVQCLADDAATRDLLAALNNPDSAAALDAERTVVRRLGATCHSAVGVHVCRAGGGWSARGFVSRPDAAVVVRAAAEGETAQAAAEDLLDRLTAAGALDLLGGG